MAIKLFLKYFYPIYIRKYIYKYIYTGKGHYYAVWGLYSVKNILNLCKFRKYAGDWPTCSSILWFLKLFLRIQDPKIPVFSGSGSIHVFVITSRDVIISCTCDTMYHTAWILSQWYDEMTQKLTLKVSIPHKYWMLKMSLRLYSIYQKSR